MLDMRRLVKQGFLAAAFFTSKAIGRTIWEIKERPVHSLATPITGAPITRTIIYNIISHGIAKLQNFLMTNLLRLLPAYQSEQLRDFGDEKNFR